MHEGDLKYEPCECGADCWFRERSKEEPCWGSVYEIEELYDLDSGFYDWVHACEGHEDVYHGGAYKPYEGEKE